MRNTWAAEQRDLSAGFCKEGLDFRFVRIRKVTMATVTAVEEIKRLILLNRWMCFLLPQSPDSLGCP